MMMVQLDNDFSKMFKTTIGVSQGGVLSPLLFSIYIDNLLNLIQKLNLGIKIGSLEIDVLAYADDILLITNTKLNMQIMLNKLSQCGEELEIKLNPDKSVYLIFNNLSYRTKSEILDDCWNGELLLAKKTILQTNSFKYLGAEISATNNNMLHIN